MNRRSRRAANRCELALRLYKLRIRLDKSLEILFTVFNGDCKVCVLIDVRHAGAFNGPICLAVLDYSERINL
jgi:hypothetical protein